MTKTFILAHDLGTTGNKASLYNDQGEVSASSFYGYGASYPRPNWVEQDPNDWWQAVITSTQQLLAHSRVPSSDIACISFSGQMMGCLPVDRKANPLRSAIIWADTRATNQAQLLIDRVGMQRTYAITGHRASASYSGAKFRWVKDEQPEIYKQAHKFLLAKDFIAARLTGEFVSDHSDASGMNLLDLRLRQWSPELVDAFELDTDKLPALKASTDIIGTVTRQAATETGLAAGTPVVIGGGDGPCAAVGAGVVRPGAAYTYIGSSSWIGLATSEPVYDPLLRTNTFAHLVPGLVTPTGSMQAAGGAYQWLRDNLCLPEVDSAAKLDLSPYELMNLQAQESPPGANGLIFLPYLLGERSPHWNPEARAAFIGLTMGHKRSDMVRAVLEGVSLNLCIILCAFQEQGVDIDEMRLIGGGAKGAVWRQILADIFRIPIVRPRLLSEATSLGAAICGGVGVDIFPDFSIAEALTPIVDRSDPDLDLGDTYGRLYDIFVRAYPAIEPLFSDLNNL